MFWRYNRDNRLKRAILRRTCERESNITKEISGQAEREPDEEYEI